MTSCDKDSGKLYLTFSALLEKSYNQKVKVASKSYRQFAHSSSEKLRKLVESAKINDKEFLDLVNSVERNCDICLNYKKLKLKAVVGLLLSRDFNDVIAVDWKQINNINLRYTADHATQFMAIAVAKIERIEIRSFDQ